MKLNYFRKAQCCRRQDYNSKSDAKNKHDSLGCTLLVVHFYCSSTQANGQLPRVSNTHTHVFVFHDIMVQSMSGSIIFHFIKDFYCVLGTHILGN